MDVVCQAAATSSERATAQMMSALDFWFLMGTIQWMVGWSLKKKHAPKTAQQTPPIEVLILLRSPYSSPREHILVVGCCWYNLHPCFQKGPKMIIQHSRFDHLFYKLAKLVCFLPGHCGSSSFAPVQMRLWQ